MAARTRTRGAVSKRPARSGSRTESLASSSHVAGIQRARLLAGAVRAVDEFGYTSTTVTEITAKAHVSRRTFYELFSNGEDCLAAMLDDTVERLRSHILAASLEGLGWRERVRGGLFAILSFLDREPVLARVCVVQSARGGQQILERREALLNDLATVIDQGRGEGSSGADCPSLTAEGLVGAALSIVHARLLRGEPAPLTDLQGELMAMIVLPYLGSAAARAERKLALTASSRVDGASGDEGTCESSRRGEAGGDPLQGISMRLTYRTLKVLEFVASQPGASNREVADGAGVQDQGQISKLLGRLERFGLIRNTGSGYPSGAPNAWCLTARGEEVEHVTGIRAARLLDEPSSASTSSAAVSAP